MLNAGSKGGEGSGVTPPFHLPACTPPSRYARTNKREGLHCQQGPGPFDPYKARYVRGEKNEEKKDISLPKTTGGITGMLKEKDVQTQKHNISKPSFFLLGLKNTEK